jgi:hypothetical protein
MSRASNVQKAQRLNLAYTMLREGRSVSDIVQYLEQSYDISGRQAYRYLDGVRNLKRPVPVGDVTVPFTVRLPQELAKRVRRYADSSGLSLSEITYRALQALIRRQGGRA